MRRLAAVSFGIALIVSALLLVLPTYSTSSTRISESPAQQRIEEQGHATILQVNDPWVMLPLVFPVLVTAIPVLLPKRSVCAAAAIVLGAFAVVGSVSIGLFYLPSAVVMLVAGSQPRISPAPLPPR